MHTSLHVPHTPLHILPSCFTQHDPHITSMSVTSGSSSRARSVRHREKKDRERERDFNALDTLRQEMALGQDGLQASDSVVQKKEVVRIGGTEVTVRRLFVLFGSYRVGWVMDSDVLNCMECDIEFTFFRRKHHCRACGRVVCSGCSPYQANIPTLYEPGGSRVCVNCFGLKVNVDMSKSVSSHASYDGESVDNASVADSSSSISGGTSRERSRRRQNLKQPQERAPMSPEYFRAYRTMRCIVPPDIAETNLQAMIDAGLPRSVAERVWQCRCLWLLSMHPEDIKKVHLADLRSKYAPIGLDLTELRAVWHVLPDWQDNERDIDKAQWKRNFKIQMDDLAKRDARGEAGNLHRHPAYDGHEPIRVFSSFAPIKRRYSTIDDSHQTADVPCSGNSQLCATLPSIADASAVFSAHSTVPAPPASSSYYTPSKHEKSVKGSPGSLEREKERRHSFSDAESSPSKSSSPYSYGPGPGEVSPEVPLFLYRRTAGDLASTEQRGRSFSFPPPMEKSDDSWIGRLKSFFTGPMTPNKAPESPMSHTRRSPVFPSGGPTAERPQNKSRPVTSERSIGSSKSSYRQRREEEKRRRRTAMEAIITADSSGASSPAPSPDDRESPAVTPSKYWTLEQLEATVIHTQPLREVKGEAEEEDIDREVDGWVHTASPVRLHKDDSTSSIATSTRDSPHTPLATRVPFATLDGSPPVSPPRSSSRSPARSSPPAPSISKSHQKPSPLTASRIRDMMAALPSNEVASQIVSSNLDTTPEEATNLLRYLVVNYCDIDNGSMSPERKDREEQAMLTIASLLVRRGHANVNALDREGHCLLTFIFNSSSSYSPGLRKLVSCLVFHGINIFDVSGDGNGEEFILGLHDAFLQLSAEDKERLSVDFGKGCADINSYIMKNSSSEPNEALCDAQYLNYFAVLIGIGRPVLAAYLLEIQKVFISPLQASALMKGCKFDTMENPVETFELLDKYGGQM